MFRSCCLECKSNDWEEHKKHCVRIDLLTPHLIGRRLKWPKTSVLEDWRALGVQMTPYNGNQMVVAENTPSLLPVDSCIFVQLLLNKMVYILGPAAGCIMYGEKVGELEVQCILVDDEEIRLDPILKHAVMEWVVGPDAESNYLGMTPHGPMKLTKEEWVVYLTAMMQVYIDREPYQIRQSYKKNIEGVTFMISSKAPITDTPSPSPPIMNPCVVP